MDKFFDLNGKKTIVIFDNQALTCLEKYIDFKTKSLIITDSNIPNYYIDFFLNRDNVYIFKIKAGEESKNFSNYFEILKYLNSNLFTRKDNIIAFGGGVVCDLAGFVAATYKRGLNLYSFPTSLLAMVDASIGGKNGINFESIKNNIGTFYSPKKIIINTSFLQSLPEEELRNGYFEILKLGCIYDEELFNLFKKNDFNIEEIIYRAVCDKCDIVNKDPLEDNERKILNFGHTVGHSIELKKSLRHGESVAIGMLFMSNKYVRNELINIYKKLNFDYKNIKIDFDFIDTILQDKKNNGSSITCVLCEKIGNYLLKNFTLEELIAYLKKMEEEIYG